MSVYVPGKSYTPTGTKNALGTKRLLASEEFDYYYNQLESSLSEPIKAGIAVVLLADIKRWALHHTSLIEEYKLPLIDKYVSVFLNYPEDSPEKKISRDEILKFDQFLEYSQAPNRGVEALSIESANKSFAVRIANLKAEEKKNLSVEELLEKELEEIRENEEKELAKDQALVIEQALYIHMRSRIREYLSGTYEKSIAKYFMDQDISDKEYKFRLEIIQKVEQAQLSPLMAITTYQAFLNTVLNVEGNENNVKGLSQYGHPLLKTVYK